MRGATVYQGAAVYYPIFQSTLLMRGATRLPTPLPPSVIAFQSTLLMRGATSIILGQTVGRCEFQSTLLMRGATAGPPFSCAYKAISIHAPHARSDPHGEQDWRCVGFQSTLLMRGATEINAAMPHSVLISIHAPHARSDSTAMSSQTA